MLCVPKGKAMLSTHWFLGGLLAASSRLSQSLHTKTRTQERDTYAGRPSQAVKLSLLVVSFIGQLAQLRLFLTCGHGDC